MRKPMRATAELLVLDEPVRPDAPTGLTAQTGQTAEDSESAIARIGFLMLKYFLVTS